MDKNDAIAFAIKALQYEFRIYERQYNRAMSEVEEDRDDEYVKQLSIRMDMINDAIVELLKLSDL